MSSTNGTFKKIEIKVNPQGFRQQRHQVTEKTRADLLQFAQALVPKNNTVVNETTAKQFLDIAKNAPKGLKEKLEKLARVAGRK
ncbi:MAG: hypothetical protein ACI8SZ_001063 [Colwellia sp.]|jgi:hypothetical protein